MNGYVLLESEFRSLLEAAPQHLKLILLTAYHTGMRRGEILSLRWGRVDLGRGMIRLPGGATKTDQGRNIPLNRETVEALRAVPRRVGSPWVFGYQDKRPLASIKRAFLKARKKAGLHDIWFPDLRHTYITNARRAGIDHFTIRAIAGHRTTAVFKRYHTIEESDVLAARRRKDEHIETTDEERIGS